MNPAKISASLADRLASAADGDVELIVELQPIPPSQIDAASREDYIATLRDAFEREAAPVQAAIQAAGGEVLGGAWLNQTLRARMPAEKVQSLADLDEVALLDLPRALGMEGG
jgi:hypothetical protein